MAEASICNIEGDHPDQISEGIFVGDVELADNIDTLLDYGITHIISFYDACVSEDYVRYEVNIKAYLFPTADKSKTNWKGVWEDVQVAIGAFLKDAAEAEKLKETDPEAKQPKLLFQCEAGIRRSALMATCFLIKHKEIPLFDAMKTVTEARLCTTKKKKTRRYLVSYFKTSLPLLEDLAGTKVDGNWFEADTWNDKKAYVCYLAGYEHVYEK